MSSIRPSWIAFGWFIAAAATALVIFVLIALNLISQEAGGREIDIWMTVAMLIGFATGGFFAGARVGRAALLHGLGIGLFSLMVWLLANLLFGEAAALAPWAALPLPLTLALLLLQTVAAMGGARLGQQWGWSR